MLAVQGERIPGGFILIPGLDAGRFEARIARSHGKLFAN